MSTAVASVREALYTALSADAPLRSLLAGEGIYDLGAPESASYDYIVIGSTSEDDASTMGNAATAGLERIGIHTRPAANERPGSRKAFAIYGHVFRLLHGKALSVNGRAMYLGRTRVVTTFLEPDRRTTTMPVEYTFRTMET